MARPRRLPPALPLALRNRLSTLILEAVDDPRARRVLEELADPRGAAHERWLSPDARAWSAAVAERAASAAAAVGGLALDRAATGLPRALGDAAALFDAGLFFEVHELLEPAWTTAVGAEREALQGLIQVAVGYQHLVNGNLRGAGALLEDGASKLGRGRLAALDLAGFAEGVRASRQRLGEDFDWALVPRFPRPA